MKTLVLAFGLLTGIPGLAMADAGGKIDIAVEQVKKCAALPVVLAAVEAQNALGASVNAIQATDKEWTEKKGELPIAHDLMSNEAAKALVVCEAGQPYFKETILTDNQGANVAITSLTSDYWQGDEPKFTEAFAGGAGSVFVARPKRDESVAETIAQVSVPVLKDGKAIGTLTMGVIVSKVL